VNDNTQSSPSESQQDPSVVLSFIGIAHTIEARLEATLAGLGLSLAKVGVLKNLAEAGTPLTLGELAERNSCVRSNITQLIDRLEADQLVRRVKDPHDRRSIRAALTPAGQQACTEAVQLLTAAEQTIVGTLTPANREALQEALAHFTS
jgi:DNA-binding MarR family transcriptional regulator